jgi:beta-lactamase superfamily II metal-dependent hydrolase
MRIAAACAVLACSAAAATAARTTLDIYFIDVEGGQSTLFVTPAGESLLVDTGFPSDGTFTSVPGDPVRARDAQRILAAARDARVTRIDYLLTTHFHADHDGGVVELAQLLPIGTFVDHGSVLPAAESVRGTLQAFERYAAVRAKGRHLEPAPGAHLPLTRVETIVVSAAGSTIAKPLAGAGARTPGCASSAPAPEEPNENPRSTGFQLRFGKFRVLDVGDLSGIPLFALACPNSLVGPVDVYLVAHHGGLDAADPATFAAFRPRVAILNNGATKGGAPETFAALHAVSGLDDVWQLHRSQRPGAQNFADDRIANLDESTAHWIKISAREDGSFTVTNGRTGGSRGYDARR